VYLFKKNAFLAFPNKTDTKKNSHEQKKASHEICVFAYLSIRQTKTQPWYFLQKKPK